jgi:hypothetical protein
MGLFNVRGVIDDNKLGVRFAIGARTVIPRR